MDSLFHFILAVVAGVAIGLHIKHGLRVILVIAFLSVAIDVDHFLEVEVFHNIFACILLPLVLFLVSFWVERGKSIKLQSFCLILLAVLVSHLVADLFYGMGLTLFYPLSNTVFQMPEDWIVSISGTPYQIVSPTSIAFTAGGVIILLAHYVEDFIYFFEEKHEKLRKALKDTLEGL